MKHIMDWVIYQLSLNRSVETKRIQLVQNQLQIVSNHYKGMWELKDILKCEEKFTNTLGLKIRERV